jgi:hypothetical protein
MKPLWAWMFAWIVVVCVLWSLAADARMNPASSFEKHSVACSAESRPPSFCPTLRVLSEDWIRSRAGPQKIFLTLDVVLRTEDLDPEAPPWLESHGPPGKYRVPGHPVRLWVAKVATEALQRGVNYAATQNFSAAGRPK